MASEKPEPPMDAGKKADTKKDTPADIAPATKPDSSSDAKLLAVESNGKQVGGMSAQAIRDAGYAIDLPMELPDTATSISSPTFAREPACCPR